MYVNETRSVRRRTARRIDVTRGACKNVSGPGAKAYERNISLETVCSVDYASSFLV